MANLVPSAKMSFATATGAPAVGWKLWTYTAGTSTPQATYLDSAAAAANTNPIIMDARGECVVYGTGTYRFVLQDSLGNTIWTRDNVVSAATALANLINPVTQYGARGDNVTDDTAALQAAINAAASSTTTRTVFLPVGTYRTTIALTIPAGVVIRGEGAAPAPGTPSGAYPAVGSGTWIRPDHTGKGIVASGLGLITGVELYDFGIYRTQPTISPGWTPTDYDWDIYLRNCQVKFDRLLFLNSTRGIYVDASEFAGYGNYPKIDLGTIWGQFFKRGVELHHQYNLVSIRELINWTYWADNTYVQAYSKANCDFLSSYRVDGLNISGDFFSIWHRSAIFIGQDSTGVDVTQPGGSTNTLLCSTLYSDFGRYALLVDPAVTSWTASFGTLNAFCSNVTSSVGVSIQGVQGRLNIGTFISQFSEKSAIEVTGADNHVQIDQTRVNDWNVSASGNAAISVSGARSDIIIDKTYWEIPGGEGHGAGKYSGDVATPEWINFTPTITPGTGAFTGTPSLLYAQYQKSQQTMNVRVRFTLPTNNTAGSYLKVTLPFTLVSDVFGQGNSDSGDICYAEGFVGNAFVNIYKQGAAYPGGTLRTIQIDLAGSR